MKHWGPYAVVAVILLAPAIPSMAFPAGNSQAPPCGEIVTVSLSDNSSNSATVAVKQFLCSHIEDGQLADLRWPKFDDYRSDLKAFYQPFDNAPAWFDGDKPSPQALAMIALFQDAEKKGLHSEDYDGPRWMERLARLMASQGSAAVSDLASFDLALTVSAMRYVSDLHNGRINPRYFQFGYDIDPKKYNLAEFLRTRIIGAKDVASMLEQVEPSYPG
jgi:murein L,D-transpeptidase YcbB/YkuD